LYNGLHIIVGFWGDHQILPVSDRLARFDLVVWMRRDPITSTHA